MRIKNYCCVGSNNGIVIMLEKTYLEIYLEVFIEQKLPFLHIFVHYFNYF